MVRVAAPGATVSLSVASSSSFGEFFSVYWEALASAGYAEQAEGVASLIDGAADRLGLGGAGAARGARRGRVVDERLRSSTSPRAREFLDAPLVEDFLLERWLDPLPDEEARASVLEEVARIIDDDRHEGDFSLTVKATIVVGKKAG